MYRRALNESMSTLSTHVSCHKKIGANVRGANVRGQMFGGQIPLSPTPAMDTVRVIYHANLVVLLKS